MVLIVASLVSLVAIAILQLDLGRRAEPVVPSANVADAGASPGRSSVTRPPPPPAVQGVRAVVSANDRCWVEAVGDGEVVEVGTTLEPGDRVVYRADRILLVTLGSAGAVDLEVNGEQVATGTVGEVVTLKLRWRDGELVAKIE